LRGTIGKYAGGQDVRRLVAETARDVAGVAENPAALDRLLERTGTGLPFRARDDHLVGRRPEALAGLVGVTAEVREDEAVGHGLGHGRRRARPAQQKGDARNSALTREHSGRGGQPAQPLWSGLRRAAGADERDAPRPPGGVYQRGHEELVGP